MRIGEILMREGHLSRDQLAQALRVQGLLGNRLGTTLLEEGLVTEKVLLEALGRQRSARTASSFDLTGIPPEVVRMVPARLAERYGVVPFHLKGRTLSVASKDVGDLLREDEIGFLTSCLVKTCIGLEFRIHEALERYYRIAIPDRHKALVRRFALGGRNGRPSAVATAGPPAASASSTRPPMPVAPPVARPLTPATPRASGALALGETSRAVSPAPAVAKAPPSPQPASPRFIELDEEDAALLGISSSDSVTPGADEPVILEPAPLPWLVGKSEAEEAAPASPMTNDEGPSTQGTMPETVSADEPAGDPAEVEDDLEGRLHRAAAKLRDVEIRDDIADVLLAFCRPHFQRRAILVNRKDHIVGWRGEGEGIERERLRTIEIPSHDPSVFLGLTASGSFWLGSLPALPANQTLVDGLGGEFPKDCVVLPIILRSRVVCYLYGDNLGGGVAGAPIAELRRLAAKASLAFEVYILKNKLRLL